MSDYNNPTAELDEAQKDPKTTSEEYGDKLKNFITNTLTSGIKLIIYCIIGLLIIYLCKIAQSNVLPTDINCYPYTDEKKGHEPEKINTFIFTNLFFSKPRKAMILEFPNSNNSFIDSTLKFFNEYKDNPKSSFLGNFFVNILQSLFVKNFNYYNTMFSFINQIPEFLLVIFGYYLGIIVFILGTFMNAIFLCYYWLSNLGWFLKKNVNVEVDPETGESKPLGKPIWVNVRWSNKLDENNQPIEGTSEWGSYLMGIILIIIFIQIMFYGFLLQIFSVFGAVFSIYCLVACFMYESKLAGKSISFTDLFVYLFKYNKLIIMTMFSYSVISSAYYSLGATSAGFAVLTLFCIYYFKIIEMFAPIKSDSDERVEVEINSKQAYKVPCDPPPEEDVKVNNNNAAKKPASSIKASAKPDSSSGTDTDSSSGTDSSSAKPDASSAKPDSSSSKPDSSSGTATPGANLLSSINNMKAATAAKLNNMKSAATSQMNSLKESANKATATATASLNNAATAATTAATTAAATAATTPVKGGKNKKILDISSDNLVRELKKFNKKYAQFLL